MTTTTLQPLTDKQRAVFAWIRDYWKRTRMAPTLREIQLQFSLSSASAAKGYVSAMVLKGWLSVTPRSPRSIVPTLEALEDASA